MSTNDRATSFTIGRFNGLADGTGLVRRGTDPRRVTEPMIQAVAADEAARQGLKPLAYAEGYGTGLEQAAMAVERPHPAGRGACDPEEDCCGECAGAYEQVDEEEETEQ